MFAGELRQARSRWAGDSPLCSTTGQRKCSVYGWPGDSKFQSVVVVQQPPWSGKRLLIFGGDVAAWCRTSDSRWTTDSRWKPKSETSGCELSRPCWGLLTRRCPGAAVNCGITRSRSAGILLGLRASIGPLPPWTGTHQSQLQRNTSLCKEPTENAPPKQSACIQFRKASTLNLPQTERPTCSKS